MTAWDPAAVVTTLRSRGWQPKQAADVVDALHLLTKHAGYQFGRGFVDVDLVIPYHEAVTGVVERMLADDPDALIDALIAMKAAEEPLRAAVNETR